MIKQVKICDKCRKENTRLYPFYKMRIEGFDTKIDEVENSLCRKCLEKFISIQRNWLLNKEDEEEYEGHWIWQSQLRDIEGEMHSIYKCDGCGYRTSNLTKYCPNCGERKGEHK